MVGLGISEPSRVALPYCLGTIITTSAEAVRFRNDTHLSRYCQDQKSLYIWGMVIPLLVGNPHIGLMTIPYHREAMGCFDPSTYKCSNLNQVLAVRTSTLMLEVFFVSGDFLQILLGDSSPCKTTRWWFQIFFPKCVSRMVPVC